jgi:hypothetical protein
VGVQDTQKSTTENNTMNIDDLTFGQIKQLTAMFGQVQHAQPPASPHLGKKCIIRTYASGVHYGVLSAHSGREVTLTQSRRIWRFDVKTHGISLSEVANHGTTDDRSRVCEALPIITILDALEIIPCSDEAIRVIDAMPVSEAE